MQILKFYFTLWHCYFCLSQGSEYLLPLSLPKPTVSASAESCVKVLLTGCQLHIYLLVLLVSRSKCIVLLKQKGYFVRHLAINYFFKFIFSCKNSSVTGIPTLHLLNYSLTEHSAMSKRLASEDVPPTKVIKRQSWNAFILSQTTKPFDYCCVLHGDCFCIHLTFLFLALCPNYTLLSCIVCCLFQGLDNCRL